VVRVERAVRLRSAVGSTFGGMPGAFWWIWLGTLINRMGGFVLPFFAFYLTGPMHRSAAFAGLVTALFGAGAAISGIVGGVLTDRVGRKPTLVGSLLANAATILALGYARSSWLLALGALAVGLATSAFRPAQGAMTADLVPAENRVRAFALIFWAINLGFSFSMAAVGLISHFGYRTLFYADAATTTLCATLIAVMVRDTTPREAIRAAKAARIAAARAGKAAGVSGAGGRRRLAGAGAGAGADVDGGAGDGLGAVLRDRKFIAFVATCFIVLVVYYQANAGLPIAMAVNGLSAGTFGLIAAINGVLIVVLQMPVTRLLQRYSARAVLVGSSLVIGVGFGVPAFGETVAMYVLCVVVMTLGEIGATPTSQAVAAQMSPEHLRGRYQGVYQLSWTLAQVVAPLVGATVIGAYGGRPLWIGCFAVSVVAALAYVRIGAHLGRREASGRVVDAEQRGQEPEPEPELATA
jgi:MFS family permease